MANPGVIGALPMPPASATPAVSGAARGAPLPAVSALASARVFSAPDFATDLARLVALLGGATDAPIEPTVEPAPVLPESADAVDALCAEVALAVPAPPVPVPVVSESPADAAPAPVAADDRAPVRSLQVTLAPPGATVAASHRSDAAPADHASPDLPMLPTAAAGAAAFTVATPNEAPTDAEPSGGALAAKIASDTPSPLPAPALPSFDVAPRPAVTPHPIVAAAVVDALQPQAQKQIAETVAWHVPAQGAAEVQIRLNPEELGPLDVQLKLDGDKVSVRFDLADERVRDVVQSSLPSLFSMLSTRGLQLDQAQVFAQSRGQGSPAHPSPLQAPWSSVARENADPELTFTAAPRPLIRRGLLDDYA